MPPGPASPTSPARPARIGRRSVVAAAFLGLAGRAAASAGAVVADAAMLRAKGAKLDGVADDLPAIQGILNEAQRAGAAAGTIPAVLFDFPAGVVLLSGPPQSGACHVSLRGAGQNVTTLLMRPGGAGLWRHGSAEVPAVGYFQAQDISFVDGNPKGSGAVGLSFRFAAGAPQSCMTWQGVALRKWTRPAAITNCPRNWHCENVTVFGPDFAMQDAAGFEIASTPDFMQGCFTYVFVNVLVANYAWGWRYDIQAPLEGQRFYSCTCYNGWGMVQAYCHGGTGPGQASAGYKSVLWYFHGCDWQGLGYGLDLVNLRNVIVENGFYIANPNTDRLPIPPAPGTSHPRERRRYMSFMDCTDVILRDVKLDVSADVIEDSLSLVFADGFCELFRAYDTNVFSFSRIFAGFEFASLDRPGRVPATMGEFDTKWQAWAGGLKVSDPAGNQTEQSTMRERGIGDVDVHGMVTIEQETQPLRVLPEGRVTVAFPRRSGGGSYFLKGPPSVVATLAGPVAAGGWSLAETSRDGFTLAGTGLRPGSAVKVDYRARGR